MASLTLSTEFNKILGLMWFSLRFIISYKSVTNSLYKLDVVHFTLTINKNEKSLLQLHLFSKS